METTPEPIAIPGSALRAQRKAYGITAGALADLLQHDRKTLRRWENHPGLSVRKQRLYLNALRKLADEL